LFPGRVEVLRASLCGKSRVPLKAARRCPSAADLKTLRAQMPGRRGGGEPEVLLTALSVPRREDLLYYYEDIKKTGGGNSPWQTSKGAAHMTTTNGAES
jgi:hypothetical protein